MTCRNKRGGLYNTSESTSWKEVGLYELGLDPLLGFSGAAKYGYDSVAFRDEISMPDQIVGVINTTEYWLGFTGLGIKPTNFTSENKPSLLSSLVAKKKIPSLSYGFTAGASYRLKRVPCSLTLGGYDTSRFVPHDISFLLDPDQRPVAAVNKVSVSSSPSSGSGPNWPSNQYELLSASEAALMTIDSSTPYLWLPESVCLKFEKALGIVYDNHLQLYVYPNGSSSSLQDWNLTFTFTLADYPRSPSANQVNITLPFDSFNLQLSYPFPLLTNATSQSAVTNYFPLRKAANNTQYTLGRVFLQESYLKLDYERNNFSVYQAIFNADAITNPTIISIPSNGTQSDSEHSGSSLSTGAIAGIAVGGAVLLVGAGIGIWLWLRHRRQPSEASAGASDGEKKKKPRTSWIAAFKKPRKEKDTTAELAADTDHRVEAPEGVYRPELEGYSQPPVELQGDDGISFSSATNKHGGIAVSAYDEANRKLHRSELHEDTASYPSKGTTVVGGVHEHYYPKAGQPISPPSGGYQSVPQSPYSPTVVSDDGQIHRSNSRNSRFREEMTASDGGGDSHRERSRDRLSPTYGWAAGR